MGDPNLSFKEKQMWVTLNAKWFTLWTGARGDGMGRLMSSDSTNVGSSTGSWFFLPCCYFLMQKTIYSIYISLETNSAHIQNSIRHFRSFCFSTFTLCRMTNLYEVYFPIPFCLVFQSFYFEVDQLVSILFEQVMIFNHIWNAKGFQVLNHRGLLELVRRNFCKKSCPWFFIFRE